MYNPIQSRVVKRSWCETSHLFVPLVNKRVSFRFLRFKFEWVEGSVSLLHSPSSVKCSRRPCRRSRPPSRAIPRPLRLRVGGPRPWSGPRPWAFRPPCGQLPVDTTPGSDTHIAKGVRVVSCELPPSLRTSKCSISVVIVYFDTRNRGLLPVVTGVLGQLRGGCVVRGRHPRHGYKSSKRERSCRESN